MKNIGTEMRNFDREHMRRVAMGMPEQQSEPRQEHAAQVFNELFRQLRAAFPASMSVFKTQADIDEFRRQWLLAFAENGITSFCTSRCAHMGLLTWNLTAKPVKSWRKW